MLVSAKFGAKFAPYAAEIPSFGQYVRAYIRPTLFAVPQRAIHARAPCTVLSSAQTNSKDVMKWPHIFMLQRWRDGAERTGDVEALRATILRPQVPLFCCFRPTLSPKKSPSRACPRTALPPFSDPSLSRMNARTRTNNQGSLLAPFALLSKVKALFQRSSVGQPLFQWDSHIATWNLSSSETKQHCLKLKNVNQNNHRPLREARYR